MKVREKLDYDGPESGGSIGNDGVWDAEGSEEKARGRTGSPGPT